MKFRGLDLNLLVALDVLLAEQNISRAAEKMHLSQSAMSGALGRLREWFEDELLVQIGRRHELTPLAEALKDPVHDLLARAEATVAIQPGFNAEGSNRVFRLLCSDYVTAVLMPSVLEMAWQASKTVRFDLLPVASDPERLLAGREIDLLVTPSMYCAAEHPKQELFRIGYSCVVWDGSTCFGDSISLEEYLSAGHAALQFGEERADGVEGGYLKSIGLVRRVEITTSSMHGLASLVVGTDRIATVHTRLAETACAILPLRILPLPVEIPQIIEVMQWHKHRSQDAGLTWLRGLMVDAAARL